MFGRTAPNPEALRLVNLGFAYGPKATVQNITLSLQATQRMVLFGPSGSGKSTVLRLIAGLERPNLGRVLVAGQDVTDQPPERRGVGMVFQHNALFAHLDVAANVAYGLVERRIAKQEREQRVTQTLALLGLEKLAGRAVQELSGGEAQRVALARALVLQPQVLLLDEPFSSLDGVLRAQLRQDLLQVLQTTNTTTVLVTHDRAEALALADQLVVMQDGRVVQHGSPQSVYKHPKNAFVARFLGHGNVLLPPEAAALGLVCDKGHVLLVPPQAFVFQATGGLVAEVTASVFEGQHHQLQLRCNGVVLGLQTPEAHPVGTRLEIAFVPTLTQEVPA